MSDLLQPGQHPDADQLSAFIEHALPLHAQQQTLAHLAICAGCREIIYISQQHNHDDTQETQTIAKRRPWLSRWNVVWPAAAALACVVILTIHLHNVRRSNNKNAIATTAEIQKTELPLPAASTIPPPAQPKQAPARTTNNRLSITPSAVTPRALKKANAENIDGASQLGSLNVLPLQNRNDRNNLFLPHAGTVSGTDSIHGSAYRSTSESHEAVTHTMPAPAAIGGPVISGAAIQAKSANAEVVNRFQQGLVSAPESNQVALPAKRPANPQYQAATAPPLLEPSTAAVAGIGQTVEVAGAAYTVDAAPSGQPQTVKRLPRLPSNLPVLAIASNVQHITLAIDTSGTLFLSEDGLSWQTIQARWTGRAVNVRLASSPSQPAAAKDNQSSNTSLGRTMSMGGAIASPHLVVFELTSDAGVVWTSTDGHAWKQK
jgi:hypothetical protein